MVDNIPIRIHFCICSKRELNTVTDPGTLKRGVPAAVPQKKRGGRTLFNISVNFAHKNGKFSSEKKGYQLPAPMDPPRGSRNLLKEGFRSRKLIKSSSQGFMLLILPELCTKLTMF